MELSVGPRTPGFRLPRYWLLLGLIMCAAIGAFLLLSRNTPIVLQPQDMDISALTGQPNPNDPCFQGEPSGSHKDLIESHGRGVRLARIEPILNKSGSLGSMSDDIYVRYMDSTVSVGYLDRAQNMRGFRLSIETFHKELEAGRGTILTRVRRIGTNLPDGQLQKFNGLNELMDFLNWPNFGCSPQP